MLRSTPGSGTRSPSVKRAGLLPVIAVGVGHQPRGLRVENGSGGRSAPEPANAVPRRGPAAPRVGRRRIRGAVLLAIARVGGPHVLNASVLSELRVDRTRRHAVEELGVLSQTVRVLDRAVSTKGGARAALRSCRSGAVAFASVRVGRNARVAVQVAGRARVRTDCIRSVRRPRALHRRGRATLTRCRGHGGSCAGIPARSAIGRRV
jgi:hypothetical protein